MVRFAAPVVNVISKVPSAPTPISAKVGAPLPAPTVSKPVSTVGRELDYLASMKAMRTAGGQDGPMMTVAPLVRAPIPAMESPLVAPIAPAKVAAGGPILNTPPLVPMSPPSQQQAPIPLGPPPSSGFLSPQAQAAADARARQQAMLAPALPPPPPQVMTVAPQVVIPNMPAMPAVQKAISPMPVSLPPTKAPGIQGVSQGEFNALRGQVESLSGQLANVIGQLQSQIAQLSNQVQSLNTGTGQALAMATSVGDSLQTLANNASASLSKISDQVDAQNQALIALARGATETFTPRRIVVPKGTASRPANLTTVDGSGRPVGQNENLNANQDPLRSTVAGYRRW